MAWGTKLTVKLVNSTTGSDDETSHTVKLQPVESAYPTGAITLSQKTVELSVWGLAADSLGDDTHYALYIDDADTGIRYWAPNSLPPI